MTEARLSEKNALRELLIQCMHDLETNLEPLLQFDTESIVAECLQLPSSSIDLLNRLAIFNFEQGRLDDVLPYLNEAYRLNPQDGDTLYNLGVVMHAVGEYELALQWFEAIAEKDDEVLQWIAVVQQQLQDAQARRRTLKFYLRRIEHEVERDEAAALLIADFQAGNVSLQDIFSVIETDIYYKSATLNRVAVYYYASELYEHVIPLLQKSLELDPNNADTLYNIGSVLFQMKMYAEALNFLKQIQQPDQKVFDLIRQAEEKAHE